MEFQGALTEDARLHASALRNLPDGLVLLCNRRVVFANRRAAETLGWGEGEEVGASVEQIAARISSRTLHAEPVASQLEQALSSETETVVEFELAGAAPQHIQAHCFPLGEPSALGILLRDVTPEREAAASKSQLLSTVSHELRTPLASIKGFATTLLRQDVKWDEAAQRDFLRIIEEESDRLTEIIDNLLDVSQMEAGALKITAEPTQLRTLIREVVDEIRMRTESHWFVVDLPADLPRVFADARRIRQVLRNLLDNALKYTKGGQITVSCEIEDAQAVVSVADQGEGIPPDSTEKIFERFFQVDGKSTRRVGGAGLGLSISRGIVQAHGGKLWAESVTGRGSTFRFALPLVLKADGEP